MLYNYWPNFISAASLELNARLKKLTSLDKPDNSFLSQAYFEFRKSDIYKNMLVCQGYYKNESDILERKRYFINRDGNKEIINNLSNTKLNHGFVRKLTDQKVNYVFSKDFIINTEDKNFNDLLTTEYFDKKFKRMLKNNARDSIVNGISWVQVYYDSEGKLGFKRIPADEVIPFWADYDHTKLDAILRFYSLVKYEPSGQTETITKVEYYTVDGVWYYEIGKDGLIADPDRTEQSNTHFVILDSDGNTIPVNWERIPFIAFKANATETSIISSVKNLIDEYDLITSDLGNEIHDIPDNVKIVRNYDGTNKEEFIRNLSTFRCAFVQGDGDVSTLSNTIDVTAIDSHLNRLRKDIYEFGRGVDTQEQNIGNPSGVALRFRYADLDLDCSELSNEYSASMESLIWFIQTDLIRQGLGDFTGVNFDIIFNTDSIINESERINDAKNSAGIISEETILANHPWVTDVKKEQETLKKDREITEVQQQNIFEGNGENTNV